MVIFYFVEKKYFNQIFPVYKKKKLNLDYFWSPLNVNKPYKNYLCENLSNTNYIWRKILILPSHTNLTKKKLDYIKKQIVDALKFYKLN